MVKWEMWEMEMGRPDLSQWKWKWDVLICPSGVFSSLNLRKWEMGRPDLSQWGFLLVESGLRQMESMRTC
jgi:hypothetical protein